MQNRDLHTSPVYVVGDVQLKPNMVLKLTGWLTVLSVSPFIANITFQSGSDNVQYLKELFDRSIKVADRKSNTCACSDWID